MRLALILVLLLLPLPSPAQQAPPPAAATDSSAISGEDLEQWRESLAEAKERLEEARNRVAAAQYAYQDWRQRKRPRGAKKAEMLAELDAAEEKLAEAEARLPELLEQARRAGVPPGVLREFEG